MPLRTELTTGFKEFPPVFEEFQGEGLSFSSVCRRLRDGPAHGGLEEAARR